MVLAARLMENQKSIKSVLRNVSSNTKKLRSMWKASAMNLSESDLQMLAASWILSFLDTASRVRRVASKGRGTIIEQRREGAA
jgi:hypothetical protein